MTAEELFDQGKRFLNRRKWDEAIEVFTRFIEEYPDDPNRAAAHSNRGNAYGQKRDHDRTLKDYNKAIELNPDFMEAYKNLGNLYLRRGDYEQAIRDFSKALKLDPRNVELLRLRGDTYFRNKDYELAIADFSEGFKLDPEDINFCSFRGDAYFQNKDYELAIKDFTEMIKVDSYNSINYTKRANAYNAKGDYPDAIEDYNTAKLRNNKDHTIFTGLGDTYRKTGKLERAIENYQEAIRLFAEDIDAYIGLGLTYGEKGDFTLAIESFDTALKIEPDNKIAIHNRAVALSNQVNEQERQKLEERVRETYNRLEGFGEKYRKESKKYKEIEENFNMAFIISLPLLPIVFLLFLSWIYNSLPYTSLERILNTTDFGPLPWIGLIAFLFSPVVVLIFYFREGKRRNELLKHSYERKAYLEDRWLALSPEKKSDMETRLIEHWMEKSPEETLLAFMNKKDSNSPPLTLAALAAAIATAASRRVDK